MINKFLLGSKTSKTLLGIETPEISIGASAFTRSKTSKTLLGIETPTIRRFPTNALDPKPLKPF